MSICRTSFSSLIESYHKALTEIEELRKRIRKLTQNTGMQCCECGGYRLCLSEGARLCSCESDPEMTEASK